MINRMIENLRDLEEMVAQNHGNSELVNVLRTAQLEVCQLLAKALDTTVYLTNAGGISVSQEEIDAMKVGNKIGAIRAYRTRTNVGLKEAKDAIEDAAVALNYARVDNTFPGGFKTVVFTGKNDNSSCLDTNELHK